MEKKRRNSFSNNLNFIFQTVPPSDVPEEVIFKISKLRQSLRANCEEIMENMLFYFFILRKYTNIFCNVVCKLN